MRNCGPNPTLASQDRSICTECEHKKTRLSGNNLHTMIHSYLSEAFLYVHKLLPFDPKRISPNIKKIFAS